MKILAATGSFKDVYSPVEAAEMLRNALDGEKNEISAIPFCDGGEYTYEVLRSRFDYDVIESDGVLNAYGVPVKTGYLADGDTAHIVSSRIIRLYPEEDEYKNPLALTDYGFGQLIADALGRGYRKLILYFGGTSTAACGMGALQALGGELYNGHGEKIPVPCTASDLAEITRIVSPKYRDVHVHVIGDGNSKVDALPGITGLKVGKTFSPMKEEIVRKCTQGVNNIVNITKISPDYDFTGAAGGLLFGLEQCFDNIEYTLGGLYFSDVLGIESEIEKADLVITGEGRYDNTADGKAPSVIAGLARKHKKEAVLVCGQIEKKAVKNYAGGVITCESEPWLAAQGITRLLTCQEYYDGVSLPEGYSDAVDFFREHTPDEIKKLFRKIGI